MLYDDFLPILYIEGVFLSQWVCLSLSYVYLPMGHVKYKKLNIYVHKNNIT
jgi:hypothetical protein